MRLLFVVQRYGHDVAGGAEAACRDVATRLAARGHHVRVLTTCARTYTTWEDEYPPGETELEGVVVERLSVRNPRDPDLFAEVDSRLDGLGNRATDSLQHSWAWLQGPDVPDLPAAIERHAPHHDAAVFFTYLYATTRVGIAAAAGLVPTALVPCAHAEPPLRWRINRRTFELADRRLFLTTEEAELVSATFPDRVPSHTVGLGTDVGLQAPDAAAVAAFRREHGLGDRPYLVSVGRVDPNKGSDWLADMHIAWRRLAGSADIPLVFVGDPVHPLPASPDLIVTGFVSAEAREAAISGSLALVHPSPYESFALTLIEAWGLGRPVLVHHDSPVLAGQVGRSGGGLTFDGLDTYDVAVTALAHRPGLADALGAVGEAYVTEHYRWEPVLDRWEQALGLPGR